MTNIIEWPPKSGGGSARRCTDPLNDRATKADRSGNNKPSLTLQDISAPVIIVRPYAGHFAQTILRRTDGSEHRLQIFPDRWAAARCAKLLNVALAEGY